MVTLESIDKKIETLFRTLVALDAKFEDKIDELATMTARGFLEFRGEFKRDMHEVIDRLEVIEENYVTKDDFLALGFATS